MADARSWTLLLRLTGLVEADLSRALQRRHALGLSEFRALSQLAASGDGELRMQELAEAIGLNQSSVTRLATRLEEAGLTRRDVCPNDRRGVYSQITEAGRALQREAEATYGHALEASLGRTAEDAELGPLAAALHTLLADACQAGQPASAGAR